MLDDQVQKVLHANEPYRGPKHFINLSRGLLALEHLPHDLETTAYTLRLPSSWCEQKMWDKILITLPPDLWLSMAFGAPVVVHDVSKMARPTRALWQGLSWIRFAVGTAWDLPVPTEYSRTGMNLDRYWTRQFIDLPKSTRNLMRYYLNYYRRENEPIDLKPCETCEKGWTGG